MTTNNTYLKTIAEKVTETEISGTHTDNYYLKLICTTYGYTYTGTVCDGKLIKDFASAVTSKTYNRIHFDNKYYHDIAESLTGNTYDNKYDNFYLGIIAENITPPTPLKKLDHLGVELIAGSQILSYADEQQTPDSQYATVRFTAYADAGETETIPNLALDFQVGSGAVTSVVTDSNGRYEYTYHSMGVGDVEISASKTVEGSLVTETYAIYDWYRYDDCSTDKTSSYTKSSADSFTFDTDHYVHSSTSNGMVQLGTGYDNVHFEVLLKHNNNAGGINITQGSLDNSNAVALYNNSSNTTYLALFPWSNVRSQSGVTNNTDYYRYILEVSGSSVTAMIKNSSGTSTLFSGTTSKSLSAKYFNLFMPDKTMNIKEIIIRPL